MTTSFTVAVLSTLAFVISPVTDIPIVTVKTELPSGSIIAQNTSRAYSSFAEYKTECLNDSRLQGFHPEDVQKLCSCVINTFEARYTLEQFKKLTQTASTNAEAENTLVEVGEICFDQILYEN